MEKERAAADGDTCTAGMLSGAHFLPSTARKLKVRLETIALMNPVQLKDTSAAEAMATPTCQGQQQFKNTNPSSCIHQVKLEEVWVVDMLEVGEIPCACPFPGQLTVELTMMGMRVATTGKGVALPISSRERTTLKAGSRVFTVWVSEMATAAKERLAATWPMACMLAGQKICWNSCFVSAYRAPHTSVREVKMSHSGFVPPQYIILFILGHRTQCGTRWTGQYLPARRRHP